MKFKKLQFFATDDASIESGAGAEESVNTAEQTETVNETPAESTEPTAEATDATPAEEDKRDRDRDSIYAEARRTIEAENRRRKAAEDAEFVRKFGGYVNPKTGQPIRSKDDYFAALEAKEQMELEAKIKEQGVDESLLQRLIDNNPAVRQAREYMAQAQQSEVMRQIEDDVANLSQLDANIKSFDNIPRDVVEYAQNHRISLTDSYKVLNYGKVTEQNAEAMRQSAVNQIKGKSHLAPISGVATENTEIEIPSNELNTWRSLFPNKTDAQLRTLYNNSI